FGLAGFFVNNPWRDPAGAGGALAQNEDSYGFIRGSNELLENEQSGTDSIGLVITPGGRFRGLSLSFDYSELFVKGGISYTNDGFGAGVSNEEDRPDNLNFLPYTLWRCYNYNDPFWCGKITFNPEGSSDEPNVNGFDPYLHCEAAQPCVARTDIVAYEDIPFNAEPYWTRNLDVSA